MAGMFTVCPKCTLTLVVTAADLRVAQGYVRCGRCSNVFNALARLSEDRNTTAAAAVSQTPQTTPSSGPPGPSTATPQARKPQATGPNTNGRQPEPLISSPRGPQPNGRDVPTRSVQQPTTSSARSTQAAPPPPPTPPKSMPPGDVDDEAIPEDALEFNPAAADVNQVFVEPPPNPEWTAATGTFKSILSTEEAAAPEKTEIELDADFLSATSQMRKLKIGMGETGSGARAALGNPASSQQQFMPSAKATPVGSPVEAPSHPQPQTSLETRSLPRQRAAPAETQPRARVRAPAAETQSQPQPRSSATQQSAPPGTEVISRAPPHRTIRAFGLDSVEPPPEHLTSLARSGVAPAAFVLEPSHATSKLTGSTALWGIAAATLLFLLVAQVLNHYRNDLAATPQFNKPITTLYAAFGVHLTPRWDLHAYDVRQLGASVDAENTGQIMVRASVKNGGQQAQPLPLLRVTLQDRFGNRIAARDVPPKNYLPRAIPAASFLSAGQRVDAEMAFVDPGSNAVGFEIDACLPAPAGGIMCANDPLSR